MSSILLTTGPVSNHKAFLNAGPLHLRKLKKELYDQAARKLEAAGLGRFITVITSTAGPKEVFVKKAPDQACRVALESSGLCMMEEYIERYHGHLPRRLTMSCRQKLVALGYLTEEQIRKK